MEVKWREGVWPGHVRSSTEVLLETKDGEVRMWSVKRLAESQRLDKELNDGMRGTPKRPDPDMPGHDLPIKRRVIPEDP